MRNATSSDGEYLPSSIAFTVCLVTPILSASSCCVISLRSKRSRRMLFWIAFAISRVPAIEHDLGGEAHEQGDQDCAHHARRHVIAVEVDVERADRRKGADE